MHVAVIVFVCRCVCGSGWLGGGGVGQSAHRAGLEVTWWLSGPSAVIQHPSNSSPRPLLPSLLLLQPAVGSVVALSLILAIAACAVNDWQHLIIQGASMGGDYMVRRVNTVVCGSCTCLTYQCLQAPFIPPTPSSLSRTHALATMLPSHRSLVLKCLPH
jgi:hypothetical protein